MTQNTFEILEEYHGRKGFFIKSFLYDDTFNLRDWRVTRESILRDTKTFLNPEFFGQSAPFILRDDRVHPEPQGDETMVDLQEPDRVGNIIDFGFEEKNFEDGATIKAWQISDLSESLAKNPNHRERILAAQEEIRSKRVQFISPSIRPVEEIIDEKGRAVVTRFLGSHNAGVDNPAYGMQKAQIKGVCEGDSSTCQHQLKNVQASTKLIPTIELLPCGSITIKSASKEINTLLTQSLKNGQNITLTDFMASLELLKVGGLDQISLQNVTRPELLLHKKDAMSSKTTNNADLKDKTYQSKSIPMPQKQAQEVEPKEDGSCPEGFVKGENGKCILTAAAYIAAEEEEEKKKKEDESAAEDETEEEDESAAEDKEELKKLKENQASLEKRLNDEIRKPLVASIVSQKSKLGLIKSADTPSETKSLMSRKIIDLKSLNADYSAMLKNTSQDADEESHSSNVSMSFEESSHSASESDGNRKEFAFLDSIRENMN